MDGHFDVEMGVYDHVEEQEHEGALEDYEDEILEERGRKILGVESGQVMSRIDIAQFPYIT